jgi:hypothetical protein
MVLVAVRKNQAAHHAGVLLQIAEIGRYDVYPEQFRFREHHARIDDNNVVAIPEGHGIHSKFAQASDWQYL